MARCLPEETERLPRKIKGVLKQETETLPRKIKGVLKQETERLPRKIKWVYKQETEAKWKLFPICKLHIKQTIFLKHLQIISRP